MLPKLLKFIVRTRFSRPFLILMAVLVAYEAGISTLIPSQGVSPITGYIGVGLIAFFLTMALATGGVMVLKSDRDYLFTLPLSTRDLSLSIFFSQFIAFGITMLFIFGYLAQSLASSLLLVDLVALALAITSLGIIATSMSGRARAILSVAMALWTLLALDGFPLSPGSAFTGDAYSGTATIVILGAVTTATAFRGLSRVELDMMKNLVRSSSSEIKSQISYSGKSPLGAIYSMNLSTISLAGRMNMMGTSRFVSRRVKTRWVVTATSAAAAAYLAFVMLQGPPVRSFDASSNSLPSAILASIFLSFLAFYLSQSAITNERIWLSLTSLPPAVYFRHLIASKVVSLLLILAPFAAADALLFAMGYGEGLGALAVVALVIPGSFVLEILWAAYIAPIQVKGDDLMMAAQFNLKQMSTALLLIPVIIMAAAATVLPVIAIGGGAALVIIASILTTSGGFWERVVTKLTENGFV